MVKDIKPWTAKVAYVVYHAFAFTKVWCCHFSSGTINVVSQEIEPHLHIDFRDLLYSSTTTTTLSTFLYFVDLLYLSNKKDLTLIIKHFRMHLTFQFASKILFPSYFSAFFFLLVDFKWHPHNDNEVFIPNPVWFFPLFLNAFIWWFLSRQFKVCLPTMLFVSRTLSSFGRSLFGHFGFAFCRILSLHDSSSAMTFKPFS